MNDIVSKYRTSNAFQSVQSEQNFALAVPAGLGAAVAGAVVWAVSVYVTQLKLGLVVIVVGLIVGYAVREAGKGTSPQFGILGAACAAFGWALGTVLCDVAFLAKHVGRPFLDVLMSLGVGNSVSMAVGAADVMDFVFLAIAVWEGYKFSFVQKQP
jgi:hypothetical protein